MPAFVAADTPSGPAIWPKDPQKSVGQCRLAANRKEQAKTTPIFFFLPPPALACELFMELSGQCRLGKLPKNLDELF